MIRRINTPNSLVYAEPIGKEPYVHEHGPNTVTYEDDSSNVLVVPLDVQDLPAESDSKELRAEKEIRKLAKLEQEKAKSSFTNLGIYEEVVLSIPKEISKELSK